MAKTWISASEEQGIPQSVEPSSPPLESLTNLDVDMTTIIENQGDIYEGELFIP